LAHGAIKTVAYEKCFGANGGELFAAGDLQKKGETKNDGKSTPTCTYVRSTLSIFIFKSVFYLLCLFACLFSGGLLVDVEKLRIERYNFRIFRDGIAKSKLVKFKVNNTQTFNRSGKLG